MNVEIVSFPLTKVAAIEHLGPPEREHETALKLIEWKIANRLFDSARYRSYGIHFTDPQKKPPSQHRVDFCLSFEGEVGPNPLGVVSKLIPALRCARARDVGSRYHNQAALFLINEWLPRSGETVGEFPMFFHYVNVGPALREEDMITDVYLPLR